MEGYIQLHRQLLESKVFANPITLKIWVWLLLKAAWKDRFVNLQIGKGFTTVSIKRGQLIFGRNKASDVLDIDANNVYRQLQAMQADNMILIEPNNQYSIITICNYDSYQELKGENEQQVNNQRTADEQPTNNQRTAGEQQVNTKKKDNTVKKEKTLNHSFDVVWNLYDKKTGDKKKLAAKWGKLTDEVRQQIMQHIPKYVSSTPDKQYRKNFETYLNNCAWQDEVITPIAKQPNPAVSTGAQQKPFVDLSKLD